MKVIIQVIKVYEIDVPDACADPIGHAYAPQTTEIERDGRLVDATTDHAETLDEIERNVRLMDGGPTPAN